MRDGLLNCLLIDFFVIVEVETLSASDHLFSLLATGVANREWLGPPEGLNLLDPEFMAAVTRRPARWDSMSLPAAIQISYVC